MCDPLPHHRSLYERPRRRAAAGLLLAVAVAVAWTPAAAQTAPEASPPSAGPPPLFGGEDDPLSPALADVHASSNELAAALGAHEATAQRLAITQGLLEDARARLDALRATDTHLTQHLHGARARERAAVDAQSMHRSVLRELAIDAYTRGSSDVLDLLDPARANQSARRRGLAAAVTGSELEGLAQAREVHADARAEIELAAQRQGSVREEQRRTLAARDAAQQESFLLAVQLIDERAAVHAARSTAIVSGLDLSMVALDAYVRAAGTMNDERPSCRLSWTVLAGIGRVESRHGTYRGAVVQSDGGTDPPIIGVALTGAGGVAFVGDSDGGSLDGDPAHDRAVGPMQFIPSSWRLFGRDGNGDDVEDPHNLYDAALAAAEHLCRRHVGLDQPAGLHAAVLGYNRSEAYVARVAQLAGEYAAAGVRLR